MSYCSPAAVIKYTPPFCPINAKTSEASSGVLQNAVREVPAGEKKKRDPFLKPVCASYGLLNRAIVKRRLQEEERLHTGGAFGVLLINVKMNRKNKVEQRIRPLDPWFHVDVH